MAQAVAWSEAPPRAGAGSAASGSGSAVGVWQVNETLGERSEARCRLRAVGAGPWGQEARQVAGTGRAGTWAQLASPGGHPASGLTRCLLDVSADERLLITGWLIHVSCLF